MNDMKNNKGFTLIELLAVIIILGILMIIAIPSVTKYITDSRKNAYISTAKEIIGGARTFVNDGNLKMYDADTTYYIPAKMIHTETAFKSPYGDFTEAYIGVTYNGLTFKYYWISNDETGTGIDKIVSNNKLDVDLIKPDIKDDDINDSIHVTGIGNRSKIKILNENGTWTDVEGTPTKYVIEDDVYTEEYMCPGCTKYLRATSYVSVGNSLTQAAVNNYTQLEDYKNKPFLGIKLDKNNKIETIYSCGIVRDKFFCLGTDVITKGWIYFSYLLADLYSFEDYSIHYDDYQEIANNVCTKLWYRIDDSSYEGRLFLCKGDDNTEISFEEGYGFALIRNDIHYQCRLSNKRNGLCRYIN